MPNKITDRSIATRSGCLPLAISLILIFGGPYFAIGEIITTITNYAHETARYQIWGGFLAFVAGIIMSCGIYQLEPNEDAVMTFFGDYIGTDSTTGLRWANPFYGTHKVTRRLQNNNIESIKVNDASGNPIEIGAAIVWHVKDSAKAIFEVDDYGNYIKIQSETALRKIASQYPYDNWKDADHKEGNQVVSLRDGGDIVATALKEELSQHLALAGLTVVDARISHLAYSPEIAQAMLKRQQAAAIVAARGTIVDGAVGLVKHAIEGLSKNGLQLDDDRKAAMATNLMVVMVSDNDASPVINAGAMHSK